MQIGKDAWNEANVIRQKRNEFTIPFSKVNDPKANVLMGTIYLNERVPELLESQGIPVNMVTMLLKYGGWINDYKKVKGDLSKLPDTAKTYLKNSLGII